MDEFDMTLAFFSGCKIPYFCPEYEISTKAVFKVLGVEVRDLEFNCCGYPIRHFDTRSHLLQAARNFAMAEEQGMDIVTPCKCCFGSLKNAHHVLSRDRGLRGEINRLLKKEGRRYIGIARVRHLLSVLAEDVGVERLAARIQRPCHGLKVAVHYGCHALRPSSVTAFDDPFAPTVFESLVRVTGAECVEWSRRLECCGQPVAEKNPELSARLAERKVASAAQAGADLICSACTYCQMQFDGMKHASVPSVLYPQVLGMSLGLSAKQLGIARSHPGRRILKRAAASPAPAAATAFTLWKAFF